MTAIGTVPAEQVAGLADGYRVGPYGAAPDGTWVGGEGYNRDLLGQPDYQRGLSQGRAARIDDSDHDDLQQQAWQATR